MTRRELRFYELVTHYDVVIMKHCYPASDVLEDIGRIDLSSTRQSLENYQTIYRLLRDKFDEHPDNLFILWTPPPRHRLYQPAEGMKDDNAARATTFAHWLKQDFLAEGGIHSNISVWDFRDLVIDPWTNFLKYEYELSHDNSDSHPNKFANNEAGPRFAQFIVDAVTGFYGGDRIRREIKIVLLHHSVGYNVYRYPNRGIPDWFARYKTAGGMVYSISHKWYPTNDNMPVHYYRSWIQDQPTGMKVGK
jgi:hypothetical protein